MLGASRFLACWVCLAVLLACTCLATDVSAQGLTGAIEGTVRDKSGGVLPGVRVTASSPALIGGAQVRVTGSDGTYHFPVLPPGVYTVTFELGGFQNLENQGLTIEINQTVTLNSQMAPASMSQKVVVTGSPIVDVRTTEVETTVGNEVIQQLPITRRFTDLLNTLPGVQNGLYTFSPANSVIGSSVTDNVYLVNGLNFVDPDVSSSVTDIPYDDIDETQVSTTGQPAEFGTASGGAFDFILKSGGNKFHGLADDYTQLLGLTSNNVTASQAQEGISPTAYNHVYDYGGDIGGPIVHDRLWFYGGYNGLSEPETYSGFPYPVGITSQEATAKIDSEVSKNSKLSFFYLYRHRYYSPFNFGYTNLDPRTWISETWNNALYGLNYTYTPNAETVVDLRAGAARFTLINGEPNVVPGTPVYIEETTGVITGGPNGNFGNNVRNRYEVNGDVDRLVNKFLGGSHEFKVGADVEVLPIDTHYQDQGFYNDTRLELFDGMPYRIEELDFVGQIRETTHHEDAFIEDQYVVGRVTINAGFRWDYWSGTVGPSNLTGGYWFQPATYGSKEAITLNNFAPRLGIAFDPTGHQTWVFRADYGRFYDRIDGTTYSSASDAAQGSVTYTWNPLTPGSTAFSFAPSALATEIGSLVSDTRPTTFGVVDPNFKMPYTDSYNVGVQHDLGHGWGIAVSGILKQQRDLYSEVNLTDPFPEAYNLVQVTNPLTNQPMTIYSIKPSYQQLPPHDELTNPSYLGRLYDNYNGLEVVIKRPLSNHLMTQISYDLGRSYGTVGTLFFDHQSSLYLDPNSMLFADGDQELDRRHMGQFMAVYQLPKGFQISGHFQMLSGLPLTTSLSGGAGVDGAEYYEFTAQQYPAITSAAFISVPVQPQGTLRTPWQNTLDLRIEKQFNLGETRSIDLILDGFNMFNANATISVDNLNISTPDYLLPASIQTPRAARLGVRFTF